MRVRLLALVVLVLAVVGISCSTAPAGPQPGTPAFYWAAAKTTFHNGDFQKTNDDLQEIARSDNEFASRARTWQIVMTAGMTQGLAELADTYEAGARANRQNPLPFRKQASALRSRAAALAMQLAESVHSSLGKDKDASIVLAFEYPTGSANQPVTLQKISSGLIIPDAEEEALEKEMMERGVLLATTAVAGSPDNPAKALELFNAPEVKVPRETFAFAAAKLLYDQSELFGSKKLDQPNRLKMLCEESKEALGTVPATKESKALDTKIQAALKKIGMT